MQHPKNPTNETGKLYFHAMGRAFRITSIFDDEGEANAYMSEIGNTEAAITTQNGYIFLAEKEDPGSVIL